MRLDQIEIVLVLANELHFGRTADRLHVSQSRVSKEVAAVERELGGALFNRTSRRVSLTPLGQSFVTDVGHDNRQLMEALHRVAQTKRTIRVGFVPTIGIAVLTRLVTAFESRFPDFHVELQEVTVRRAFAALHDGAIDVMTWWRIEEPGLGITVGPSIDRQARVAVMSAEHPLAGRARVSTGEVEVWTRPANYPSEITSVVWPDVTPGGVPIVSQPMEFTTFAEFVAFLLRSKTVHASVTSFTDFVNLDDLVTVPIDDLPPIDLVMYWCSAREDSAIRALAQAASDLGSSGT